MSFDFAAARLRSGRTVWGVKTISLSVAAQRRSRRVRDVSNQKRNSRGGATVAAVCRPFGDGSGRLGLGFAFAIDVVGHPPLLAQPDQAVDRVVQAQAGGE